MNTRITTVVAGSLLASALVAGPAAAQDQAEPPMQKRTGQMMHREQMMGAGQMMGHGAMMGDMRMGKMMGLASMVPGADLQVTNQRNGVAVKMTADDPATVANIQKIAQARKLMFEAHESMRSRDAESAKGHLRMSTENVENGATVRITTDDPDQVPALQKMARAHALMWEVCQSRMQAQASS